MDFVKKGFENRHLVNKSEILHIEEGRCRCKDMNGCMVFERLEPGDWDMEFSNFTATYYDDGVVHVQFFLHYAKLFMNSDGEVGMPISKIEKTPLERYVWRWRNKWSWSLKRFGLRVVETEPYVEFCRFEEGEWESLWMGYNNLIVKNPDHSLFLKSNDQ